MRQVEIYRGIAIFEKEGIVSHVKYYHAIYLTTKFAPVNFAPTIRDMHALIDEELDNSEKTFHTWVWDNRGELSTSFIEWYNKYFEYPLNKYPTLLINIDRDFFLYHNGGYHYNEFYNLMTGSKL